MAVLACCAVALASAGCTSKPGSDGASAARPSVLLVTIDTLRADHVGAYGYQRATSPHLDAIAAQGVLFETAYAPSSATGPSHATLFTGLHPIGHGVVRNGVTIDDGVATLASLMSAAGYRSAAFISSYPVAAKFGFARGFAHYDEDFAANGGKLRSRHWQRLRGDDGALDRRGAVTVDAANAWLTQQNDDVPLFVWVHLFDPHMPYAPPPPYDTFRAAGETSDRERTIALYDGEISYADAQLGRLVEAFERTAKNHLVVVTSDHGEGLWDHGYAGHNRDVFEEEVRVPLVLRWRDAIPAGARVAEPVHLIDILPTLAAACGLAPPSGGSAGLDLLGVLVGQRDQSAARSIYLTRPYFGEHGLRRRRDRGWGFGIRRGPWKLIEARAEGRLDLFQLDADPRETRNLAADEPARADALAALVAQWRDAEMAKRGGELREVPREVRRQLRALGYVQ